MTRSTRLAATAALGLALAAPVAQATEWRFTVVPYVWATDVGVQANVAGDPVVDTTIPVDELVADLDFIVQLRGEAQKGAHGVTFDVFDVRLSDRVVDVPLPDGAGTANLDSEIGMTIVDVTGLHDPKGDAQGISFLYGARIVDERATVDAWIVPTGGSTVTATRETHDTSVDGLLGVRYRKAFSPHWSVRMSADASTGGTDHTWSVGPGVTYAFGETARHAVTLGYRHLEIDFADEGAVESTMTLSGPQFGYRLTF